MKLPLYMDENNDIYDANHKLLVSGTHTEVETGIGMLSKYEPVDKKTAEFFVKAVNNYEQLIKAIQNANDKIYAVGAPLGSENYFEIRKILNDALHTAQEDI